MDKKVIYENLNKLEENLKASLVEVAFMKSVVDELTSKNFSLEVENQLLRERLSGIPQAAEAPSKTSGPSKARMVLEGLYFDGFHVCNNYYGQRREDNEECLLCMSTIDRK